MTNVLAVTIGAIDCSPKWSGDDLCHDGARYGEKQSGRGDDGGHFTALKEGSCKIRERQNGVWMQNVERF